MATHGLPAELAAKPDPSYVLIESRWQQLREKYPGQPAVILDYVSESEILQATFGDPVTRSRVSLTMAVFDVEAAGESLDRMLMLSSGEKLKGVWAWSHELGASDVVWAREKDFHERRVFGDWKEIRVSIPGLSKAGVCGVEMETQRDGLPFVAEDFITNLPLVKGETRVVVPSVGEYGIQEMTEALDRYYRTAISGPVAERPAVITERGYTRAYAVQDLPARPRERLAAARDFPRASVYMVPSWIKWKLWTQYYGDGLAEVVPPKSMVQAARDSLAGAAPLEIVRSIARYLDDPAHFRLLGSPRSAYFVFADLAGVVSRGEGDAFDKAVLAHSLLDRLGVESHLVFAAGRHLTVFDGRIPDPRQFDAVLLSVPSVSPDFIWDIADRSVPLGEAGPDLDPGMLLCDPDATELNRTFPLSTAPLREERGADLSLEDDGLLQGSFHCRFSGWPTIEALDPWNPGQDVTAMLQAECPGGTKVETATWTEVDRTGLRCTPESPAVLRGSLTAEAIPHGEGEWEIRPLFWPLPEILRGLNLENRRLPVLLPRNVEVIHTTRIRLGGHLATELPPGIRIDNNAGSFQLSWEKTDDAITGHRRLVLAAQHAADGQLTAFAALCRAWDESARQTVTASRRE